MISKYTPTLDDLGRAFPTKESPAVRDALLSCEIFRAIDARNDVAAALLAEGTLEHTPAEQTLVRQGERSTHVYFVLDGTVDIVIDGRPNIPRTAGALIGEMALVRTPPERSATMITKTAACLLRVEGDAFRRVAQTHGDVWLAIARQLTARMEQRLLPKRNSRPVVFVGSSSEQSPFADEVVTRLGDCDVDVINWRTAFDPSRYTLDSLRDVAERCDFAVFVFAGDDETVSRGVRAMAVRDNVVLEYGWFASALGYERVFWLHPEAAKIPSDMAGNTYVAIRRDKRGALELDAVLGAIRAEGTRDRYPLPRSTR